MYFQFLYFAHVFGIKSAELLSSDVLTDYVHYIILVYTNYDGPNVKIQKEKRIQTIVILSTLMAHVIIQE